MCRPPFLAVYAAKRSVRDIKREGYLQISAECFILKKNWEQVISRRDSESFLSA